MGVAKGVAASETGVGLGPSTVTVLTTVAVLCGLQTGVGAALERVAARERRVIAMKDFIFAELAVCFVGKNGRK